MRKNNNQTQKEARTPRKTKTILRVKGICVPRILIWLRGFLHRKLRTGGLDPETDTIASGYISGQIKRFRNACVVRREQAERKLAPKWIEADQLLIDLASVTAILGDSSKEQPHQDGNSDQARAGERRAARLATHEAERKTILKNIVSVTNDILTEFDSAYDEMEATAEALLSTFSCYGHGLTMQPIYSHNLPPVDYEDCANQILVSHESTWNAINGIFKEVK